ncbi:hypothetical protein F5Y18DRAFT_242470 [Xylariaceae sp. FL1019]|nr:hypothetical protein F5Y18DRAFT_242470 [Xylariaceae sp. FL1019]
MCKRAVVTTALLVLQLAQFSLGSIILLVSILHHPPPRKPIRSRQTQNHSHVSPSPTQCFKIRARPFAQADSKMLTAVLLDAGTQTLCYVVSSFTGGRSRLTDVHILYSLHLKLSPLQSSLVPCALAAQWLECNHVRNGSQAESKQRASRQHGGHSAHIYAADLSGNARVYEACVLPLYGIHT